ncbi:hypothetical protein N7478_010092 [Penicillium angulare]|uniref:uncharacterized protein n=1 Tax=Penicillium angulare TaxID=116970 RepID=UPI002541DDD1|nr:uncharacterized protein N7478_010092 [Penicillium angulare]KAJ5267284.1 hypothetical protein N7478_010092 [Penicillium angulare]
MTLWRLQSRLQVPVSILRRQAFSFLSRRAHGKNPKSEGEDRSAQRDSGGTEGSPKHPIPSNQAHPTLQDGKDSPIADFEGNLRGDLPKEVQDHNKEVERRNDLPHNQLYER